LRRPDFQVDVAPALQGPRQLGFPLFQRGGIVDGFRLQLRDMHSGDKALLEQAAVDRERLAAQFESGVHLPDLRPQRGAFLLDVPALRLHQPDFAFQRGAAGGEQRAFLAQHIVQPRIGGCHGEQIGRKAQPREPRLFSLQARDAGPQRLAVIGKAVAVRIDADVAQDQQGIARLDLLPVAHQHRPDDAAFAVLHRAPVEVDLDIARRQHCRSDRRQRQPERGRDHCDREQPPGGAHDGCGLFLLAPDVGHVRCDGHD
jgi:hypothetical protein